MRSLVRDAEEMRGQLARREGTGTRREEVVAQEAAVLVHGFRRLQALNHGESLECARAPMGDGSCEVSASVLKVEEGDDV